MSDFIRDYLMLKSDSRKVLRTIGDLFYYMCDEAADIKFSTSLMLVIELLGKILNDNPVINEEIAHQIMDAFLLAIPTVWRQKLKISV